MTLPTGFIRKSNQTAKQGREPALRFHKNVPQGIRQTLLNEFVRYTANNKLTHEELCQLRQWVQSGHSPYDNNWNLSTELGSPMDFVCAHRALSEEPSLTAIYDTELDDIVFVMDDNCVESTDDELPF